MLKSSGEETRGQGDLRTDPGSWRNKGDFADTMADCWKNSQWRIHNYLRMYKRLKKNSVKPIGVN
jgi:hypothetical protein